MELELKREIVNAAVRYADQNGLSQEVLAGKAGINISYLNAMFQELFYIKGSGGKRVEIKDSYFKKLAQTIGFDYEPVFWELVETPQYLQIYTELEDARLSGRVKMLIGETGCGKTFTIDRYLLANPSDCYRITVSSLYNLYDIIYELCDLLDLSVTGSFVSRLKKIGEKMRKLRLSGSRPLLILDESENLSVSALKMLKALYDAIRDFCPIVLVGTSQLVKKLDILQERDVEGIPQFVRRFKAGRRDIFPITKRMFVPFLSRIADDDLRVLIETLSSNYGELHDYIEPALRESARTGDSLTEERFRFQFGLIRNL